MQLPSRQSIGILGRLTRNSTDLEDSRASELPAENTKWTEFKITDFASRAFERKRRHSLRNG